MDDGSEIQIFDTSSIRSKIPSSEAINNVYRVKNGRIIWQINPDPPLHSKRFTNFYFDQNGRCKAFTFDCYEYDLDLQTGRATDPQFTK